MPGKADAYPHARSRWGNRPTRVAWHARLRSSGPRRAARPWAEHGVAI